MKSNDQSLIKSTQQLVFLCSFPHGIQTRGLGLGGVCVPLRAFPLSYWMVCTLTLSQLMFSKLCVLCCEFKPRSDSSVLRLGKISQCHSIQERPKQTSIAERFIKYDKFKWSEKETKWKSMLSINMTFCYAQHSNAICSIYNNWADFICREIINNQPNIFYINKLYQFMHRISDHMWKLVPGKFWNSKSRSFPGSHATIVFLGAPVTVLLVP